MLKILEAYYNKLLTYLAKKPLSEEMDKSQTNLKKKNV